MREPSNRFVRWYWTLFTKWNHCSLQFDDSVVHCFDGKKPRWFPLKIENKMFVGDSKPITFYIGETKEPIGKVVYLLDKMPVLHKTGQLLRYITPLFMLAGFVFPKMKNGCVHKTTYILNVLFGYSILYTHPDGVIKEYKLDINNAIK